MWLFVNALWCCNIPKLRSLIINAAIGKRGKRKKCGIYLPFFLWSESNAGGTRGLWLEELWLSQKNKRASDFIASEQTAAPENTEKNIFHMPEIMMGKGCFLRLAHRNTPWSENNEEAIQCRRDKRGQESKGTSDAHTLPPRENIWNLLGRQWLNLSSCFSLLDMMSVWETLIIQNSRRVWENDSINSGQVTENWLDGF